MQKYDDSAILIRYCHEPTKAKHWAPSISLHDQTSHTRQPIVQCAITPILCHCENSAHEGNAISLVVTVLERLATNASRDDADSSRLARSRRRRLLRDGIYKTGLTSSSRTSNPPTKTYILAVDPRQSLKACRPRSTTFPMKLSLRSSWKPLSSTSSMALNSPTASARHPSHYWMYECSV